MYPQATLEHLEGLIGQPVQIHTTYGPTYRGTLVSVASTGQYILRPDRYPDQRQIIQPSLTQTITKDANGDLR